MIVSLLIVATLSKNVVGQDAWTIEDVFIKSPQRQLIPLSNGLRGKFTVKHSDDGSKLPFEDDEFEYTHGHVYEPRNGDAGIIREIVVAKKPSSNNSPKTYGSRTVALKELPPFQEILALTTIDEFRKIFGPTRGFTDAWGNSFFEKTEWHSQEFWNGFVKQPDGTIRVISVFLHTVDYGDGWKIDKKHILEGTFVPTGKVPLLR